ncbi:MAG TPA: DUF6502 family protein [Steroidobacteraceae bacterium]|nr:DUF6502 family protein [Steroidobacteraceae bacterium]
MKRAQPKSGRKLVIREAIVQLFALQLSSGTSLDALRLFALSCVDSASRKTGIDTQEASGSDVQTIGSLLRTWHRETRYLSKDGSPRPLGLSGKNGLRKLVCLYFDPKKFDSVFEGLQKSGLIKETRQKKWIPTGKYGVVPIVSKELLAHLAEGVSRYVETITRNVTTRRKENTLFERSSKVRAFPVSAAEDFRILVNRQAIAFLAVVDDWLEARVEEASNSRSKKCTAGVFAFAFLDDIAMS